MVTRLNIYFSKALTCACAPLSSLPLKPLITAVVLLQREKQMYLLRKKINLGLVLQPTVTLVPPWMLIVILCIINNNVLDMLIKSGMAEFLVNSCFWNWIKIALLIPFIYFFTVPTCITPIWCINFSKYTVYIGQMLCFWVSTLSQMFQLRFDLGELDEKYQSSYTEIYD